MIKIIPQGRIFTMWGHFVSVYKILLLARAIGLNIKAEEPVAVGQASTRRSRVFVYKR